MYTGPRITYKPFKPEGYYCIFVTKLPLSESEYRVTLFEELDPHNTELFDLNLRRAGDRRKLENYVREIRHKTHLKGVWFGVNGCIGDCYYTLEKFRENNKMFSSMDYLNDLNFN